MNSHTATPARSASTPLDVLQDRVVIARENLAAALDQGCKPHVVKLYRRDVWSARKAFYAAVGRCTLG